MQDQRDELRVTGGQEADVARVDPAVDVLPALDDLAVRVLDLDRTGDLGRPRLAGHGVARDRRALGDAVVDRVGQQLDHRLGGLGPHDPLRPAAARSRGRSPSASVQPSTMCGVTRSPPLAKAAYPATSWTAVRLRPWPNAFWAVVRSPDAFGPAGSQTRPVASPASSIPVGVAETEAQECLVQLLASQLEADLRGADVVRQRSAPRPR